MKHLKSKEIDFNSSNLKGSTLTLEICMAAAEKESIYIPMAATKIQKIATITHLKYVSFTLNW